MIASLVVRTTISLALAVLAIAIGPSHRAAAEYQLFTVNTTADSFDGVCNVANCSLREAIGAANVASGFDYITFAIPSLEGAPVTLTFVGPLPAITSPVLIDGEQQFPANCGGLYLALELDGSALSPGTADGLVVSAGATGSVIRGLAIGGFPGAAIVLESTGNTVNCNRIGTDATGTVLRPNGQGIRVTAANNLIGGAAGYDAPNQISANLNEGVLIYGATGTLVRNNTIGAPIGGSPSLGNLGAGVYIEDASGSTIGGTGVGNSIYANGASGVAVTGETLTGNRITRNSLAGNTGAGIDLLGIEFEDPVDVGDADAGPNKVQNPPAIESAVYDAGANTVQVAFRVESDPANAAYPLTVEFFETDADGDEGETFLGSATFTETDWMAATPLTAVFTPAAATAVDDSITATATDADGNTSEFPSLATTLVPEPGAPLAGLAALLATAALARPPFRTSSSRARRRRSCARRRARSSGPARRPR
jgi:CSLREA domain-containing protein